MIYILIVYVERGKYSLNNLLFLNNILQFITFTFSKSIPNICSYFKISASLSYSKQMSKLLFIVAVAHNKTSKLNPSTSILNRRIMMS